MPQINTLTRPEYHRDTSRISKSGLGKMEISPLHYWDAYLNPDAPERDHKKHFDFGDIANDLLLLPMDFAAMYVVIPSGAPNRPTSYQLAAKRPSPDTIKAVAWWNDFKILNAGKTIITRDDYDQARRIVQAVQDHPPARELLAQGIAEQTHFFKEPMSGAPAKIRPDWNAIKSRFLVDFKTAKDASPDAFGRAALTYRYHGQGAFYYDGFALATGETYDGFAFIVAEKTRPWPVKVYYMDDADLEAGRNWYLPLCDRYVECRRNNSWPGYGDEPERLRLPHYAFKQL